MTIKNIGNIGIGTTNPNYKLEVNGAVATKDLYIPDLGTSGTKHLSIGDDIFFTDIDRRNIIGLYGNQDSSVGGIRLGSSGADLFGSNGNIGIGTTNPTEKLQIENGIIKVRNNNSNRFIWSRTDNTMAAGLAGDGGRKVFIVADNSTRMTIDGNTGNVGIGISTPPSKLHILNISNQNGFVVENSSTSMGGYGLTVNNTSTTNGYLLRLRSSAVDKLIVTGNGDVGIGTTDTKGFKLGVNGRIAANEIKVATYPNWPDFVFENNYNLPTLKEVEQQITENGHLKNIPSAEEIKKDGFFLGEMDSKLLQKIEELMLYTIDQEKKLEIQNNKIKSQSDKIEKLEIEKLKSMSIRLTEIEKLLRNRK